ncbi:MAG: DEAD/DEAH box helicase [Bacteroidales bacterium]|nr:DEAD/DEAH box helicase [Bacteroidales bacterium]
MTFEELQIDDKLLEAISYMRFEKASPIQEQAIPLALQGNDLLACAQTGTGKTATFLIPILQDLVKNGSHGFTSLIIVPTRELAIQIDQELQGFSYFTDTTSKAVYGGDKGADWDSQKNAFTEGTNVIIATPGRLMAHLRLGYVSMKNLRHLVLDEADRMLDMGFIDDIRQILSYVPQKRQTMLFSATMAPEIQKLAQTILHEPKIVSIAIAKPAEGVKQSAYMAYPHQKVDLITHILEQNPDYDSIIIFTSTKKNIHSIVSAIKKKIRNVTIDGISSDFEQAEREEVLLRFRAKQTRILVATDVLSRGIDIKGINLVINFDVPRDAADYVHRVGRTARADAKGEAITFISDVDVPKFHKIEHLIERSIDKIPLPQELGEAPEWKEYQPKPKRHFNHSHHANKNNGGKKRFFYKKKKNEGKTPSGKTE